MKNKVNYFYGIDFLRWVAALAIVFYHYLLHFQIVEINSSSFLNYLVINKEFAQAFVWMFWAISGFVFTNIYIKRDVTFKKFFVARFARLYPLHFVTLILVTVLQFISFIIFDYTYQHSYLLVAYDLYHFILNIFFASNWGLEKAWSFNTPVWSVSVEVPIYFLFFSSLFFIKKYKYLTPLIIICFVYFILPDLINILETNELIKPNHFQKIALSNFPRCIFYFFLGSFVFFIYSKLKEYSKILSILSFFSTLICITLLILESSQLNNLINSFPSTVTLFFSLILFFACFDDIFPNLFKKFSTISTTSYSIYLIHFPMQLIMLIIVEKFSLDFSLFKNYFIFLLFIGILQYISILSFKYLESPLRKIINLRYK